MTELGLPVDSRDVRQYRNSSVGEFADVVAIARVPAEVPRQALHLIRELLKLLGVGGDAIDVGALREISRHLPRATRQPATVLGLLEKFVSIAHLKNRPQRCGA